MNTLDLLNEISTSKLAKKTDAQLLGVESARQKNITWTKEKFLPVWEEAELNKLSFRDIKTKYGITPKTYKSSCGRFDLPMKSRPKCGEVTNERRNIARSQNAINKPYNQDVINGMNRKEWAAKYGKTVDHYDRAKARLRKKGLVD